jgi:hypothetical protein
MRTLVLMVAFGFGSVWLLPRPARALDDCVSCKCKEAKAWQNTSSLQVFGLRQEDPTDPTRTIPVLHSPWAHSGTTYYCAIDTLGTRTKQGEAGQFVYNQTPDQDCKPPAPPISKQDIVRVNFANETDWNDWTYQNASERWICQP